MENEQKTLFIVKRSRILDHLATSFLASVLFLTCAIGFNFSDHLRGELLGTVTHYLEDYIQMGDKIEKSESVWEACKSSFKALLSNTTSGLIINT